MALLVPKAYQREGIFFDVIFLKGFAQSKNLSSNLVFKNSELKLWVEEDSTKFTEMLKQSLACDIAMNLQNWLVAIL